MPLLFCAALGVELIAFAVALGQTPQYLPGLFLSTSQDRVELTTYVESAGTGAVHISGSLETVPTITPRSDVRVLAAVPLWPPVGVIVATQDLFKQEYAERVTLVFGTRKLNVAAVEMRIGTLETGAAVARLIKMVRATEDKPAYVFIILGSQGIRRYYPIRLSLGE